MRMTVAQAAVRFLAAQYSERDGEQRRLIAGWERCRLAAAWWKPPASTTCQKASS